MAPISRYIRSGFVFFSLGLAACGGDDSATNESCEANSCDNGGTCVESDDGIVCECATGFEGATCDVNTDDCGQDACVNGTCTDGLDSFGCECDPGYEGDVCDVDIDDCAANPCVNAIACTDAVNDYSCTCQPGWSGDNCDTDINECETNPCLADSACTNLDGSFSCACPSRPGNSGPGPVASATLFNSPAGAGAISANSQSYLDGALNGYFNAGADDFSVGGHGWLVSEVLAMGDYSDPFKVGSLGPANSLNLYFDTKSSGSPSETVLPNWLYAFENLSYTDIGTADLQVSLPTSAYLSAGDYWLAVQANQALLVTGQWSWTEASSQTGDASAWFQNRSGVITGIDGCVNTWGARSATCGIGSSADLAFSLMGQVLRPGVVIAEFDNGTTIAEGSATLVEIVLDAPPLAGQTVTLTLSSRTPAMLGLSVSSLDFDAGNWNVGQTVQVTAIDNSDVQLGQLNYGIEITSSSSSASSGYANHPVADLCVVVTDDE